MRLRPWPEARTSSRSSLAASCALRRSARAASAPSTCTTYHKLPREQRRTVCELATAHTCCSSPLAYSLSCSCSAAAYTVDLLSCFSSGWTACQGPHPPLAGLAIRRQLPTCAERLSVCGGLLQRQHHCCCLHRQLLREVCSLRALSSDCYQVVQSAPAARLLPSSWLASAGDELWGGLAVAATVPRLRRK